MDSVASLAGWTCIAVISLVSLQICTSLDSRLAMRIWMLEPWAFLGQNFLLEAQALPSEAIP